MAAIWPRSKEILATCWSKLTWYGLAQAALLALSALYWWTPTTRSNAVMRNVFSLLIVVAFVGFVLRLRRKGWLNKTPCELVAVRASMNKLEFVVITAVMLTTTHMSLVNA